MKIGGRVNSSRSVALVCEHYECVRSLCTITYGPGEVGNRLQLVID